jgi:hypothetical protein
MDFKAGNEGCERVEELNRVCTCIKSQLQEEWNNRCIQLSKDGVLGWIEEETC